MCRIILNRTYFTWGGTPDADTLSASLLWFTNQAGDKLWHLPYDMTEDYVTPELVEDPAK